MKIARLLSIAIFMGAVSYAEDYNAVNVYGGLLYNILALYVNKNPGYNSYAVRLCLNSKSTDIVFKDAQDMGYSRRRVIKCAYALSLQQKPLNQPLVKALKEEMQYYILTKDILYWGTIGCSSFSTIVSLYGVGFFIRYYRTDKRVINHYRRAQLGGFIPAAIDSD